MSLVVSPQRYGLHMKACRKACDASAAVTLKQIHSIQTPGSSQGSTQRSCFKICLLMTIIITSVSNTHPIYNNRLGTGAYPCNYLETVEQFSAAGQQWVNKLKQMRNIE